MYRKTPSLCRVHAVSGTHWGALNHIPPQTRGNYWMKLLQTNFKKRMSLLFIHIFPISTALVSRCNPNFHLALFCFSLRNLIWHFRAGLRRWIPLAFVYFKMSLFQLHFWRMYTGYRILVWRVIFSFRIFKISFQCLLACIVPDKKYHPFFHCFPPALYLWYPYFSPTDFLRFFFLSLFFFSNMTMIAL